MNGIHTCEPAYHKLLFLLLMILLVASHLSCSVDSITTTDQSLSALDVTIIGAIMGETISDESSGVVSGINDAVANISRNGISPGIITGGATAIDSGAETDFNYRFNPETGVHTITFRRTINIPAFTKNISDTSNYLYTDADGSVIENVEENRERIQNLSYSAVRSGTISALQRTSNFTRSDTLELTGMAPESELLRLDGKHVGSGSFQTTLRDGTEIERLYTVEVNILNLQIQKALVQRNQDLSQGISGTLTWEIAVQNPDAPGSESDVLRGNIEMFGDGTALLRFNQLQNIFEVDVNRGNIRDGETEFEGRVLTIRIGRQVVRLVNRRSIQLDAQTRIRRSGDFTTLAGALKAVRRNVNVRAEGDGRLVNGNFVANDIKFEIDDDEDRDDDEEVERTVDFESPIRNVNLMRNVILLQNNLRVEITSNTIIENDADELNTLRKVADAINNGQKVVADGEGIALEQGPVDIEATEIEFETEDERDQDNQSDDDGENDDDNDDDDE